MTTEQIEIATEWLKANKQFFTRIRPRITGSIVRYVPRIGWGPGLDGHVNGAPAMWSNLDAPDPMDTLFRELNIPVDQPL